MLKLYVQLQCSSSALSVPVLCPPTKYGYFILPGVLGALPGAEQLVHIPTFQQIGEVATSPLAMGQASQQTMAGPSALPTDTDITIDLPGTTAVPQRLVKKILNGDFVDMSELLPDSWRVEEMNTQSLSQRGGPRRGLVTDILIWLECFATLASVITSKHPDKAPHLFAYARTIVRASRNFEGLAWVSYDTNFRRQAANQKSWDWGNIDPAMFNEAFCGRAKLKPRCKHCLSDQHEFQDCPLVPPTTTEVRLPRAGSRPLGNHLNQSYVELCGLFNKPVANECRYTDCKYAHICSLCRQGPHPASQCSRPRRTLLALPPQTVTPRITPRL